MTTPEASELQWLAYCYVTGELSADAHAQFEDRMAHDQCAREAVAAAVVLTQNLAAAVAADERAATASRHVHASSHSRYTGIQDTAAHRSAFHRLVIWSCATVVVAGLAFAIGVNFHARQSTDVELAMSADPQAGALVQFWSQSAIELPEMGGLDGNGDSSLAGSELDMLESSGGGSEMASFDVAGGDLEIPDWLLAAVSADGGGTEVDPNQMREDN